MRLPCSLIAVVSTLSVSQVPVTASVGSDVVLSGVMSLGVLHLVGANQSDSDHSRILRDTNIDGGDKEERGLTFAEVVEKLMAKNIVEKMTRTQSFSALEKIQDPVKFQKISEAADNHLASVFKFAKSNKMGPDDMAMQLKTIPEADDALAAKTVELYTSYLKHGKIVD